MCNKKEYIAMILAGGQGKRLCVLTTELAKPAVPFGGKYRIIDYTLSNCVNSGIDTVGILTQYQPLELNRYIGSGQPWDLDTLNGGAYILPPYIKEKAGEWYKGTANAIYQNINFIEQYNPEYVLVLSGDHIYKMNYSKMLDYHKEMKADCTIATLNVPMEEANRFGIMNANEDGSIYEFEEKPEKPKSNKASMGIYIFTFDKLRKYLENDELNKKSSNDFGKNVIPDMLNAGERMFAYTFQGYWKDVGTIESLWEANMDLLNQELSINMNKPNWKIYHRTAAQPPHYIGVDAKIKNSTITEGCTVYGELFNSILFTGVNIEKDAVVSSSVVMRGSKIGKGAVVKYAIIAEDAVIEDGAIIGDCPQNYNDKENWGIAVIGRGAIVKKGQIVLPKEIVAINDGNGK